MLELWNNSSIASPPVLTWTPESVSDVNQLKHIIKNIIKVLNKQSPLQQEKTLMARFLYKFDKKFRNDLGYKNFKKVYAAIKKLMNLHFLKEVESFGGLISSSVDNIYLPSRQMLEYLLVRMLTFSKVLLRINICSKQAAVFYLDRVKRGESHWMSLLPYALLSRVWSMSLILLEHTCSWYTNLIQYHCIFQKMGLDFLPNNYKLPLDLNEWLDIKKLDCQGRFQWTFKKTLSFDTRMLVDEDEYSFESILGYVSNINEEDTNTSGESNQHPIIEIPITTGLGEDCGEGISRESFRGFFNMATEEKIRNKSKNSHFPINFVNKNTLEHFISEEESLRFNNSSMALTSHLSFMQWQALKSSLTQLQDSLGNSKNKQRKFKKIWQEKCLNYC